MACSNQLNGWVGTNGGIVFSKHKSPTKVEMSVPCGQCWSCRLARSREWATRLVKESLQWPEDKQLFITLTYNNENLPKDESLDLKHFQDFMKRLRDYFNYPRIKYFHCGEYGTTCKNCGQSYPFHQESRSNLKHNECKQFLKGLGRPHYHAIIYGISFDDLTEFKRTSSGELIYKSQTLDNLWGKGFTSIGNVTFESCAYVARYIMKKITGDNAESHYQKELVTDETTGEIKTVPVKPEYITMSRNPAIAKEYFKENMDDISKHDGLLLKRQNTAYLTKPPRYFLKLLESENITEYDELKSKRRIAKRLQKLDNTPERCIIKEKIKKIKTSTLNREFEDYHNAN